MRGSFLRRSNSYRVKSLTGCDKFQQQVLAFDLYRRPFRLFLPDDQAMYRTLLGSFLTLITLVTVFFYAGWKLMTMFTLTDY